MNGNEIRSEVEGLRMHERRTLASHKLAGGIWVVLSGQNSFGELQLTLELTDYQPRVQGRPLSVELVPPSVVKADRWLMREGMDRLAGMVGGKNVVGVVVL